MCCAILRDNEWRALIVPAVLCFSLWMVLWIPYYIAIYFLGELVAAVVPRVDTATLYALDLTTTSSATAAALPLLAYNLSAVLSFRNPAVNYRVSLREVAAAPLYGGQQMAPPTTLPSFQLDRGMSMAVPWDAQGRYDGADELARKYAEDVARGFFAVDVKVQAKEGLSRLIYCFVCTLYFPVPPAGDMSGGAANIFDGDDCMVTGSSSWNKDFRCF